VSAGSIISAILTFVVVLGIMGVALRLLRKYTVGASTREEAISMEVVQRLSLGQRQGIAVVRVADRTFMVSMGEGGVRFLAELDPSMGEAKTNLPRTSITAVKRKPGATSNRISYVAPLEDFRAVLSMSMSESARP
jgi:flagellar biogenesis protein FliO